MTSISTVQSVATEQGYGGYTRHIQALADLVDSGASQAEVSQRITTFGAAPRTADTLAASLFERLHISDAGPTNQGNLPMDGRRDGYDRATTAEVIREFITAGKPHLVSAGIGQAGATEEQVTALLQIAGLEDVPVPEPTPSEAEVQHEGLLTRLAAWARGKGFNG